MSEQQQVEERADVGETEMIPPEKDPYFVTEDGVPFTGVEVDDPNSEPASEAKPEEAEAEGEEAEAKSDGESDGEAKDQDDEDKKAEPEEDLTQAFIALKRQKKAIARREREAQRVVASISQREADLAARESKLGELEGLLQTNKRELARRLGLDFRELAEEYLSEDEQDPRDAAIEKLTQKVEYLEKKNDDILRQTQAAAAAQAEAEEVHLVTGLISDGSRDNLAAYADTYGLETAAREIRQAFYQRLEAGEENLSVSKLLDEAEEQLSKFTERRAQPKPDEAKASPRRGNGAVQSAKPGAQTEAPATLSNRVATERASPDRELTPEEAMAQAIGMVQVKD